MNLPDPETLYNIAQGVGVILAVLGLAGATVRGWLKRRKSSVPKLPADTFAIPDKAVPNPEDVALRQEVAELRATVSQVQGQLTAALEQNRLIFQLQAETGAEAGAYRRRVRQLEDAWPDGYPRPAIRPGDHQLIASAINDDTIPRIPKEPKP